MNALDFRGRTAVVTGGAAGIGFAVAQRLAASGATVAVWDRDEAALASARARSATRAPRHGAANRAPRRGKRAQRPATRDQNSTSLACAQTARGPVAAAPRRARLSSGGAREGSANRNKTLLTPTH